MSINSVTLLGHLGKDPISKQLSNGTTVCNFSIATSEKWDDKRTGNKKEKTEWHQVVVYGANGENCSKYLAKGRQVYIEGKLQTRKWDDKNGIARYLTEIIANRVLFLFTTGHNDDVSEPDSDNNGNFGGTNYDETKEKIRDLEAARTINSKNTQRLKYDQDNIPF